MQKQSCCEVEQPISFLQNEVAHMDTEATGENLGSSKRRFPEVSSHTGARP